MLKTEDAEGLLRATLEVIDIEGRSCLSFPLRRRFSTSPTFPSQSTDMGETAVRTLHRRIASIPAGPVVPPRMFPIARRLKKIQKCAHESHRHGICPRPDQRLPHRGEHYEDLLIGAAQSAAGWRFFRSVDLRRCRAAAGQSACRGTRRRAACRRAGASAGFTDDRAARQRSGGEACAGRAASARRRA